MLSRSPGAQGMVWLKPIHPVFRVVSPAPTILATLVPNVAPEATMVVVIAPVVPPVATAHPDGLVIAPAASNSILGLTTQFVRWTVGTGPHTDSALPLSVSIQMSPTSLAVGVVG